MISHKMFGLLFLFLSITLFNVASTSYMTTYAREAKYMPVITVLWCIETYILFGLIVHNSLME